MLNARLGVTVMAIHIMGTAWGTTARCAEKEKIAQSDASAERAHKAEEFEEVARPFELSAVEQGQLDSILHAWEARSLPIRSFHHPNGNRTSFAFTDVEAGPEAPAPTISSVIGDWLPSPLPPGWTKTVDGRSRGE